MPSSLAFSRATESEAREAKRRHSSALISIGFAFARAELDHFSNRFAESVQPGLVLPGVEEATGNPIEHRVERFFTLEVDRRGFGGLRQNAPALEPLACDAMFSGRDGIKEMTVEFGDSQLVKMLDERQEAWLVSRHVGVRRADKKRLIAFVAAPVDQVRGFGIGASDDDARQRP